MNPRNSTRHNRPRHAKRDAEPSPSDWKLFTLSLSTGEETLLGFGAEREMRRRLGQNEGNNVWLIDPAGQEHRIYDHKKTRIPGKFYKHTEVRPTACTVAELRAILSELPDDLRIADEFGSPVRVLACDVGDANEHLEIWG